MSTFPLPTGVRVRGNRTPHRCFHRWRLRAALSVRKLDCISPIDGRVVASVASGGDRDVDARWPVGRAVFERGDWSRRPPRERKQVLLRFADCCARIGMSWR